MCLITGLATALGVSTAAIWGGLASAAVGVGSAIAGGVAANTASKRAEGKQNELMRQMQQQQELQQKQQNSIADRQMETASTLQDRASKLPKRSISSLRIPMLKTQGTGMNPAVDTGNGLNIGG